MNNLSSAVEKEADALYAKIITFLENKDASQRKIGCGLIVSKLLKGVEAEPDPNVKKIIYKSINNIVNGNRAPVSEEERFGLREAAFYSAMSEVLEAAEKSGILPKKQAPVNTGCLGVFALTAAIPIAAITYFLN